MEPEEKKVRIAAVGDIHVHESDKGKWKDYFTQVAASADVFLIAGDLTHTGDESEAEVLLEELRACTIPIVVVLGNHDYEKGRQKMIRQILQKHAHLHVLDGESVVLSGIGFAGVKGFGGGFDNHMLSMFGEQAMKAFVQEAVDEALHLERALARLDQEHEGIRKIALMHYSPVSETVIGEPEVIFPFLGSSRLAEPLVRRRVVAAFHGHAHAGNLDAEISGVRIFNVAKPVLQKEGVADGFFVFEI
ncbi:metallophosphoesterase family protein [Taibaiella helva]|uniref:metallophosphoesterase family protein n=1 Tax=Taibaiella helva TaxID=2301235 RepID=UPI000E5787AE|nr:metallophosphoesterase [Taibaiella helva]